MAMRLIFISIIFLHYFIEEISAYRDVISNGVRTILAEESEKIRVTCEIDSPLSYCGFIHPKGKRFSGNRNTLSVPILTLWLLRLRRYSPVTDWASSVRPSGFSGQDLSNGICSHDIRVKKEDNGDWLCHMGKQPIGLEITQRINVRVVGKLAAVQSNISTLHGEMVVLACTTAEKQVALKYCRFEPPVGEAFSINSNVNSKNIRSLGPCSEYSSALLDRYYFPDDMSLDGGDCAVVIKKVKYEDVGVWTCGAAWDDGQEYFDQITVHVQGLYAMSTVSVAGTAVGAIITGIAIVMLLLATWKKRHVIGYARRRPQQRKTTTPPIEMQARAQNRTPQRSPQSSRGSRNVPLVIVQSPSEPSSSPLV